MKTFYTDGTGSQQTLNDSQTEKVVVYDTINDAEADLANLAEGQIIATKDEDFEGNAVPVNEVAVNNMHSVTSNAVAEAIANIFSANIDNSKFSMPAINQEAVTADYTGFYYMTVQSSNTATVTIWEDDNKICNSDLYTSSGFVKQFVVLVRKGRKYKWSAGSGTHSIQFQYFVPFNI